MSRQVKGEELKSFAEQLKAKYGSSISQNDLTKEIMFKYGINYYTIRSYKVALTTLGLIKPNFKTENFDFT